MTPENKKGFQYRRYHFFDNDRNRTVKCFRFNVVFNSFYSFSLIPVELALGACYYFTFNLGMH